MSTQENSQKKSVLPPDKVKVAIIGSLIILVIMVGVGITSFYLGKKQAAKKQSPIPTIDLSAIGSKQVLGAQVFNWQGTIVEIDKSIITVTAKIQNKDDVWKKERINVKINSDTELQEWDLTVPASIDQPNSNKKTISSSQLKNGQQVIIRANENINDQKEVTASAINVLVTP